MLLTSGRMLLGPRVLEAAAEQLELDESIGSLAQRIKVSPVADTQLIQLHVQDTYASRAVRLANTIADVFVAELQMMQQEPYAGLQAQITELEALVEETQREIATQSASRIAATTELGYQENLLAKYRSEHRALQQDYADLQLVAAQSVHEVGISEAAAAQRGQTVSTSA